MTFHGTVLIERYNGDKSHSLRGLSERKERRDPTVCLDEAAGKTTRMNYGLRFTGLRAAVYKDP